MCPYRKLRYVRRCSTLPLTLARNIDPIDELPALLAHHSLIIADRVSLGPELFHAQSHLPWIAGIYVYPSSAPLHVTHRHLGSRTQTRAELLPGSCLLRGERARREWTIAVPPLLAVRNVASRVERLKLWSERTRKFALLADADTSDDAITYAFEAHRPRGSVGRDEQAPPRPSRE